MWAPTMTRSLVPPALVLLAWAAVGLSEWTMLGRTHAQAEARPETPQAPPPPPPAAGDREAGDARGKGPSEGEKAILALDDAFIREYNKGDSKALAAMFAEDAEVLEAEGDRYQGREQIEQRLADTFAANPGVKIAIETDAIRFLTPEVAQEEGRSLVTPTVGSPVESSFTVLYVRRDGRWLISSVREDPVGVARPHDRLKDLEWMVGEWVEERPDSSVRLSCRWAEGGNFLLREVTVKREGKPVMSISQRIGWDPLARQIRSWEFDSAGGFGEGRWSRDGDRWTIKHTGVQAEGMVSSATNIMTKERPDVVSWVSTDRVVGDETLPDTEADVLVRVPPPPQTKPMAPATPAPSPNATRSPR